MKLSSGPLKLVVNVSETGQSREQRVEFRVRGADDNGHWVHVTKHHLREMLQIGKSEMLYPADSKRGNTVMKNVTEKDERQRERQGKVMKREDVEP